jgi:hypothetical protein
VRQQLLDRDVFFAVCPESGPIFGDIIVERKLPFFGQLHDGCRCRNHFGERSEIENVIGTQRLIHGDKPVAESVAVEHAAWPAGYNHGARDMARTDLSLDNLRNSRKALRRDGDNRRFGRMAESGECRKT